MMNILDLQVYSFNMLGTGTNYFVHLLFSSIPVLSRSENLNRLWLPSLFLLLLFYVFSNSILIRHCMFSFGFLINLIFWYNSNLFVFFYSWHQSLANTWFRKSPLVPKSLLFGVRQKHLILSRLNMAFSNVLNKACVWCVNYQPTK